MKLPAVGIPKTLARNVQKYLLTLAIHIAS